MSEKPSSLIIQVKRRTRSSLFWPFILDWLFGRSRNNHIELVFCRHFWHGHIDWDSDAFRRPITVAIRFVKGPVVFLAIFAAVPFLKLLTTYINLKTDQTERHLAQRTSETVFFAPSSPASRSSPSKTPHVLHLSGIGDRWARKLSPSECVK